MDNLTRVYVDGLESSNDETIEVQPEYVYLKIPAKYVCTYNKILVLLADYGIDMLKDCSAECNNKNKSIIKCFNMFNAAVAAYKLEQTKLAETIIKYVDTIVNKLTTTNNDLKYVLYSLTNDGNIEALVSCGEEPKFEIKVEDGTLWEEINNDNKNSVFIINEEDGTLNIE